MSYSEKMLKALQEEELAEAQLMFAEALRKDDNDELADLGDALLSLGFLEESKQIFEELLIRVPDADGLYLPLAEIAIEDGEFDEALALLDHITKTSPSYVPSLLVTADLYQVMGITEVSEAKLREAQQLVPEEPLIHFALGELYYVNGQFEAAIEEYSQLLSEDNLEISGVSINDRLGSAYSMTGAFEEAIPFLENSLKEGQTDDRLFQLAFTYLQMDENQKAIILLQQLRALNPQYQSLYLYLGEALQEEELLEEAQSVFEEGINENPYQVELYQAASENAYRLHDSQKAEELLKKAIELEEKLDESLLTLSNLYRSEERFDEVIETIEKMEEKDHPYALWNLANANNALENFEAAKEYYQKAYEELKHEPEFLKEYGIFLREEGNLALAKELLLHYLKHEPGDTEVSSILDDLEES